MLFSHEIKTEKKHKLLKKRDKQLKQQKRDKFLKNLNWIIITHQFDMIRKTENVSISSAWEKNFWIEITKKLNCIKWKVKFEIKSKGKQ